MPPVENLSNSIYWSFKNTFQKYVRGFSQKLTMKDEKQEK